MNTTGKDSSTESGQSLVLIALLFVVLLLFVGLAVDVGFAFARSSQFSRSVDSAVLAGVIDLDPGSTGTSEADLRASQFLAANGWPTSTLTLYESSRSLSSGGIPQFTITATWPVESYFMRLIGISGFPITHAATAAYFTSSELFTPTGFDQGFLGKANLFLVGSEGCASLGDPVIPLNLDAGTPNENHPAYGGHYRYRISIPGRFPLATGQPFVRVEIFDPDSVNLLERANNSGIQVTHSEAFGGFVEEMACVTAGWGDRCIVYTGEDPYATFQNPFWLWRVDTHYDSSCNLVNNGNGDTVTSYELYFFNADGRRETIAKYTVDNEADASFTDLNWVSPGNHGGTLPPDDPADKFEFNLNDIPPGDDGSYSVFLDVRGPSGASINSYDIWAGPPAAYYTGIGLAPLEMNANLRNLQLKENPVGYSSAGVSIFALGRLPLQYFQSDSLGDSRDDVTLPLILLDVDLADQTIYATAFDYNPVNSQKSMNFTIDTVDNSWYDLGLDLVDPSDVDHQCQPVESGPEKGKAVQVLKSSCETSLDANGTCNDEWIQPQAQLCIPIRDRFFGGGIVEVTLEPDADAHTWQFAVTAGDPFLTR